MDSLVVSLGGLKLQDLVDTCVVRYQQAGADDCVKTDVKITEKQLNEYVQIFRGNMVEILNELKKIDKNHLNDVWGLVLDPSHVRLRDGLYRKINDGIGEYEIHRKIKEKNINEFNEVMIVKDISTGSVHIMKTTPLENFSENKELECMLDFRIENFRPKLYAIYLKCPSTVYLHMEFFRLAATLDELKSKLMPKIRQEMAIPYVFHFWFIAACLENVRIIQNCEIAHNDLTEGNILIALADSRDVSVMFIDFELSSTLDEENPDEDIKDIGRIVQDHLYDEIMASTGITETSEVPVEAPVKERILRILNKITNQEIGGSIDGILEDLIWVLDEIDRDQTHRQMLFSIIKTHYQDQDEIQDIGSGAVVNRILDSRLAGPRQPQP